MSAKYLLTADTLQTVHAKVFSLSMFCFVIHEHVEVFDQYIMLVLPSVINDRLTSSSNFSFDS